MQTRRLPALCAGLLALLLQLGSPQLQHARAAPACPPAGSSLFKLTGASPPACLASEVGVLWGQLVVDLKT